MLEIILPESPKSWEQKEKKKLCIEESKPEMGKKQQKKQLLKENNCYEIICLGLLELIRKV